MIKKFKRLANTCLWCINNVYLYKKDMSKIKLNELKFDDLNANKGNSKGGKLISKSLRELGAGRSILLDKNNNIIAGNKTIENAAKVGYEDVLIVETTGNQIVAVKRTDVDLNSKKGRELALADNSTANANLVWDEQNIEQIVNDWDVETTEWGVVGFDEEKEQSEPEDLSDKLILEYKLEIDCNSEEEQELLYNDLTEKGYICRVLTL